MPQNDWQFGVFSEATADQIEALIAESSGAVAGGGPNCWVRPQAAVRTNGAAGTFDDPFPSLTIARAAGALITGAVINLEGVLREQYTTPLGVNNVTINGAQILPRQATTSGTPNGGGATWLVPSSGESASSALIRVQGQGWTLNSIYFNSTGITSNGCIEPYTVGDPPLEADGAHLTINNCILTGAKYGIYCATGTNFVRLYNSEIFGFGDSGDIALSANASIGTLLDWRIIGNKFYGNANHIIAPFNKGTIKWNDFDAATAGINLTGGTAPNRVLWNSFDVAAADFDPAGGITGVTGDVWSNTLKDAIETGLPAN